MSRLSVSLLAVGIATAAVSLWLWTPADSYMDPCGLTTPLPYEGLMSTNRDGASFVPVALPDPAVVRRARMFLAGRGHSPQSRATAALCLLETDAAEQELRAALRTDVRNWALWNDLAVVLLDGGAGSSDPRRVVTALDAAARASRLAPTEAAPWFNLGLASAHLGLNELAKDDFVRATQSARSPKLRAEVRRRAEALPAQPADVTEIRDRLTDVNRPLGDPSQITSNNQVIREALFEDLLRGWGEESTDGAPLLDARFLRARALAEHLDIAQQDRFARDCVDEIVAEVSAGRSSAVHTALTKQADGFRAVADGKYDAAERDFRAALDLLPTDSVCALQTTLGLAVTEQQRSDTAMMATVARVERRLEGRNYGSLRARARWLAGIGYHSQFEMERALPAFRDAFAFYEGAGEPDNAASVARAISDTYRRVGDLSAGWVIVARHLQAVDRLTTPQRRYLFLYNASLFAADDGYLDAAVALQTAALAQARERGVASAIVEALVSRATLFRRLDDALASAQDLNDAEALLPTVRQASVGAAELQGNWLRYEKAQAITMTPAIGRLLVSSRLVSFFAANFPDEVPRTSLVRSQLASRLARLDWADTDARAGLDAFEAQWRRLSDSQRRGTFLAASWDLVAQTISLASRKNHAIAAFQRADALRARGFEGPGTHATTFDEIQGVMAADSAIVYFASLPTELLRWTITPTSVEFASLPITAAALSTQVWDFRRAVFSAGSADEIRASGREFFEALFSKLPANAGHLIIVPDASLHLLPFAALTVPDGGFLIERARLDLVTSMRDLLTSPRPAPFDRAGARVTAVAGRSTVVAESPAFTAEAAAVAGLYGAAAHVISGPAATPRTVLSALKSAQILHVAAHAQANADFPWASRILLEGDEANPEGWLTAQALARATMPRLRLAVLAACETAGGSVLRGEGLVGLIRPLIRPGVAVAGTLWAVPDNTTRILVDHLHREFVRTGDPVGAVQAAQIAAIHSGDPSERLPRGWAAFLIYGR